MRAPVYRLRALDGSKLTRLRVPNKKKENTLGVALAQRMTHGFFGGLRGVVCRSCGVRTARIASSNTFLRPFCLHPRQRLPLHPCWHSRL